MHAMEQDVGQLNYGDNVWDAKDTFARNDAAMNDLDEDTMPTWVEKGNC